MTGLVVEFGQQQLKQHCAYSTWRPCIGRGPRTLWPPWTWGMQSINLLTHSIVAYSRAYFLIMENEPKLAWRRNNSVHLATGNSSRSQLMAEQAHMQRRIHVYILRECGVDQQLTRTTFMDGGRKALCGLWLAWWVGAVLRCDSTNLTDSVGKWLCEFRFAVPSGE